MTTRYHWRKGARKTGCPTVQRTYWDLRQEVKREIKIAEKEVFADQILRYPNNTNNIWKIIQQCNNKNDETIAEDFNRIFVSIGQSTAGKIQSLANECDLTLNANYFVPRLHLLSEQFTLN